MQGRPTLLAGEVTCLCAGAKKSHRPHSLHYEKTTSHTSGGVCVRDVTLAGELPLMYIEAGTQLSSYVSTHCNQGAG